MAQQLSEIQGFHGLPEGGRTKTQSVQLVVRLLDAQRQLQPERIDEIGGGEYQFT